MLKSLLRAVPPVVLMLAVAACGSPSKASQYTQKMVILGFDGMDPRLVQKWMAEGQLPNLKKLADGGGFYRLETTTSPESPTAWSSFAIGVNAGKHNIYDFLVRDTQTYAPDLGMVKRAAPELPLQLHPARQAEGHVDPRRHVLLGARGPAGVALGDPHRARHVPARERSVTGSCSRVCRCPTSAAPWAPSTTSRPT